MLNLQFGCAGEDVHCMLLTVVSPVSDITSHHLVLPNERQRGSSEWRQQAILMRQG